MLASSFLDPVLGIDIHFEMVPTPAPVPTPIPNPFIGIVFDPIGLAAGIAIGAAIGAVVGAPFQGPVLYWTAFPATNTGTEAKHVPGHILIPPGTMWAPFPKTPKPVIHPGETPKPALPVKPENDAVVITGSKTVTVMGSNAARLGDIALSCSEPLRLPSSVVLAIPKGAPILIGGPPSLDIMAALMASLRTRFVSDSLHALLSRMKPSRFRNFLHRTVCFFTGHPVDVASGKVMTEFVDAALPGPLPLEIRRVYSSAFASRPGPDSTKTPRPASTTTATATTIPRPATTSAAIRSAWGATSRPTATWSIRSGSSTPWASCPGPGTATPAWATTWSRAARPTAPACPCSAPIATRPRSSPTRTPPAITRPSTAPRSPTSARCRWTGTPDELLEASKAGLDDVAHLRGDLKIPATGEVLAKNVTPAQAFDELMKWHDAEKKKSSCT